MALRLLQMTIEGSTLIPPGRRSFDQLWQRLRNLLFSGIEIFQLIQKKILNGLDFHNVHSELRKFTNPTSSEMQVQQIHREKRYGVVKAARINIW